MAGAKIFISYKHLHEESEDLRRAIEVSLIDAGYEVLVDGSLQAGDRWPRQLYDWLLECAAAIIIASREARDSDWCQREWHVLAARAISVGIRVIPVRIGLSASETGALSELQSLKAGPTIIEEIAAALEGIEPSSISADDYLALHSAWNAYEFNEAPVLGREPFSIAEIYQDMECGELTWGEIAAGNELRIDPFQETHGGRSSLVHATMMRLLDPSFREIVVVQGPAGSGKSVFTLRLTQELEAQGLRPVRVRFRDMRLATFDSVDEVLGDAVRVGPDSEQLPTPSSSLFDPERINQPFTAKDMASSEGTASPLNMSRWVFILDGWDEVSLAGSSGYGAQLRNWLPKIREFFRRGRPVRIVITGRPSIELKESGFLRKETPILTVRPMRPRQLEAMASKVLTGDRWPLEVSRCRALFERYAKWFNKSDESGAEMLGLPLLALLAFRTLASWHGDVDGLVSSPSALYRALIEETAPRAGKSKFDNLDDTTILRGGESLHRLLTRTAATISMFWSERISFEELSLRLDETNDLEEWVSAATEGNRLHELVVNFYFKGGHPELGCEFLHKSFREYLFAEAILTTIEELGSRRQEHMSSTETPYWRDFDEGTLQHRASREISRLLAPTGITSEVRNHLFWLLDQSIDTNPDRWIFLRDLLADVYEWWAEGVLLRPQPGKEHGRRVWREPYVSELTRWALPFTNDDAEPKRTATLDAHLGHALVQIVAYVHWRLREAGSLRQTGCRYQRGRGGGGQIVFSPGNQFLTEIASRWATVVTPGRSSMKLMGVKVETNDVVRGLDFSHADFRSAEIHGRCISTSFVRADLRSAKLGGTFIAVAFNLANLADAELTGTFLACRFTGAEMHRAKAWGTFRDCQFSSEKNDHSQFVAKQKETFHVELDTELFPL